MTLSPSENSANVVQLTILLVAVGLLRVPSVASWMGNSSTD